MFPKVPYLDDIATKNPDARRSRPEDFVDLRFVRELEASGYIDRLYGGA